MKIRSRLVSVLVSSQLFSTIFCLLTQKVKGDLLHPSGRGFFAPWVIGGLLVILLVGGVLPTTGLAQDKGELPFNKNDYVNEFFVDDDGIERGSCGAAAVVLVEHHIDNPKPGITSSISSEAVKKKNAQMNNKVSGNYYVSHIEGMKSQLLADHYKAYTHIKWNNQDAIDTILRALQRKHWVIIQANNDFDRTQLGHFYPVYGWNIQYKAGIATIDTTKSEFQVIQSFNKDKNLDSLDEKGYSKAKLDAILKSMKSASAKGAFNILEIGRCGSFRDVTNGKANPDDSTDKKDIFNDEKLCEAVTFLGEKGIVSPNQEFHPDNYITRQEMATFLMRVYCSVRADNKNVCPAATSHEGNIGYLVKLGLTSNTTENFRGTESLTRDEMAKFLITLWHLIRGEVFFMYWTPKCSDNLPFKDMKVDEFCPFIEELATLKITEGCNPKNYCPKDTVLRSEMARFLYRMFHVDVNGDKKPDISQNNVSSGLTGDGKLVAMQVNKVNSSQRSSDSREVSCPPQNFSLKRVSELDNTFSDEEFPQGIIEFETPCEAVEVTLFYHGVDMNNPDSANEFRNRIYRTYGLLSPNDPSAKGWSILPNVTIGQTTIDEQEVGTVSFILQDGEVGDETGTDGKIVHKGGIAVANNTVTEVLPAQCLLYGVYDQGLNNSQFFVVNPQNEGVTPLGNLCQGCDIEAMDVQPFTNILYAASGNKTEFNHPKGHLYQVDAQRGQLVSIGETGFEKISSLAFDATGTLWGWAAGEGLIQIDTETGKGTLFLASTAKVEDLTWNLAGTMLYGAIGKELWAYEAATGNITKLCDNLPLKTEGIKILPDMMLPDDFLMLGMHQDKTLKLHAFDVKTCEMVISKDIPIPYDDVEGLAMPKAVCVP